MDKIKIIENFFTEEQMNKIGDYFDKVEWQCKCDKRPNANLQTDVPFWRHELSDNDLFYNELRRYIQIKFNALYHVKRVYTVAQTYEQNSNYHTDDNDENSFTLCLYINKDIKEEDEGYFYLKVPKKNEIIAINPLFNRVVYFPANYRHKGTGSKEYLRMCVAWKLELTNNLTIPKFIERKEPSEHSIIPKRILQMFRTTSIHPFIHNNIMKMLEKNKQYEYHFMTHEDGEELIKKHFDENVLSAFKKVKLGAAIGDFIRYVTLYIHGGIYLDLDAGIEINLDIFFKNGCELYKNSLEKKEFIFFYDDQIDYKMNQWLIMTKPQNKIIKHLINEMVKRIHNGEKDIFIATGPSLFTDVVYNLIHKTDIYDVLNKTNNNERLIFLDSLNIYNNEFTKNGLFLSRIKLDDLFQFRIDGFDTTMLYQEERRYCQNDSIYEETK